MSEYVLSTKMPWYKSINNQLIKNINSLINSFSDYVSLELIVPSNIVYRTEMICDYISKQTNSDFGIYDLINLLYITLIDNSTKKYEPYKILKNLNKTYDYDDIIKISDGTNICDCIKKDCKRNRVIIKMNKTDASKGQLLLDELEDLYGHGLNLDKMVYKIWINFIEEYKTGENSKILSSIITMLKSVSK